MFIVSDIWANGLFSGGVPVVIIAAVGAAWRLRKRSVDAKRDAEKVLNQEQTTANARLDRMELFLVGRAAEGGMPKIGGFLDEFTALRDSHKEVVAEVSKLTRVTEATNTKVEAIGQNVEKILEEWTPNGGGSSYDKLTRVDKGNKDGAK